MHTPLFLVSALLLPILGVVALPQATTTAYEAPRPSSVPGFYGTFTYTTVPGGGLIGGNAHATGGANGGEAAGTAQGGGTFAPQATGHVSGSSGDNSGALAGGVNPGQAAGCAGGQAGAVGTTSCLTVKNPRPTAAPRR